MYYSLVSDKNNPKVEYIFTKTNFCKSLNVNMSKNTHFIA